MVGLFSALLLAGDAGAATSPIKNGKINACYKVRGKAKGSMRLLAGKGHCKRGERKLSWSVAGTTGAQGATGAQGGEGSQGSTGPQGNPGAKGESGSGGASTLASLESKVASLNVEVKTLEDLLEGVNTGDLSGALSKLNGITGTQLGDAVSSAPIVSSLAPKVASVEGLLAGVGSGDLSGAVSKLSGVTGTQLNEAVSGVTGLQSTVTNLGSTVSGLGSTVTGLTTKTGALCTQAKTLTDQSNLLGSTFGEIKVLSGIVSLELPKPAELTEFTAC